MKYAFSAKRAESRTTRLPYLSAIARTARRFAIETGWPPAVLFVIVTMINGTRSWYCSRAASSFAGSTLPLKGISSWVSFASSIVQSRAVALRDSMCPLVVSKCELPGTMSPCFTRWLKRTFSAARPWCVGITYSKPVRRVIVSLRWKNDVEPA